VGDHSAKHCAPCAHWVQVDRIEVTGQFCKGGLALQGVLEGHQGHIFISIVHRIGLYACFL
jgi:hypothetical protein